MKQGQSFFSLSAVSFALFAAFGFTTDQARVERVAAPETPAIVSTIDELDFESFAVPQTLVLSKRDVTLDFQGDCWTWNYDENNPCEDNYWDCKGGTQCKLIIDYGEAGGGQVPMSFPCGAGAVKVTDCNGLWTIDY